MTPTDTTAKPKAQIAKPAIVGQRVLRADAQRNRDAVLEAARKLFAEHGNDAQMDDIASKAKVGVGTVYRHFPTKDDLLLALIEKRFEALTERAAAAVAEAREGEPWTAFRDYILWSAELQSRDRALSQAMADRSEKMACCAEDSGLVGECNLLIDVCQRAGVLRKDFEMEDIPAMVCSVGAVAMAASEKPRMRWERTVAIWLDGVRAPAASKLPPIE